MAHRSNDLGRPFVVLDDDGYLQLYTHTGELVSHNLSIELQDEYNSAPTVVCKFVVNVAKDKEEMFSEIERLKNIKALANHGSIKIEL